MNKIPVEHLKSMMLYVSENMMQQTDMLTKADQAIGDGDHGIGMERGFTAVRDKLSKETYNTVTEVFGAVGTTLMMSVGGSSGAIFGTLYKSGSKEIHSQESLDSQGLATLLENGLLAIQKRGGAKPGDKTMIDALHPAAEVAKKNIQQPILNSLKLVVQAAEEGVENSKNMVATMGRAKTLGDRCLGAPDPGAISMSLMLRFMKEYVESNME